MTRVTNLLSELVSELDLSRDEWLELLREVDQRIKSMRPAHIKSVHKKCGSRDCWCYLAEFGHGPYLYVVYTERGKQIQRSLGLFCDQEEIDAMRERPRPQPLDFVLTGRVLDKAKRSSRSSDLSQFNLTDSEFQQFYGVPVSEDKLSRPRRLVYDYVKFEKALNEWDEEYDIVNSPFISWGVCSSKGYSTLKSLTARGYYLVP